jgi:CDP-paratose 2-epimerase
MTTTKRNGVERRVAAGLGVRPGPPSHGGARVDPEVTLITGGAGFIGANLADRLAHEGHRVRILDNLSRPGVEHNLRWLEGRHSRRLEVQRGDIRDLPLVREAVAGASRVFHFAAQVAVTASVTDPLEDFHVNLEGTLNLLEAVRSCPRPPGVIMTSTNKVYGALEDLELRANGRRYEPVDSTTRDYGVSEQRPLDLLSPYGCSKGGAEQYVLDYARTMGLDTAVFRMSCVYGPRQFGTEDQGWVAHFMLQTLREERIQIYGDGRQVRDLLFVHDLLEALRLAAARLPQLSGRAFNIGGGPRNLLSLLELVDLIEGLHGQRPRLELHPWRPGDQRYYVSDTRRFQAATGWRPRVGVYEGARRLYRWLADCHPGVAGTRASATAQPWPELTAGDAAVPGYARTEMP